MQPGDSTLTRQRGRFRLHRILSQIEADNAVRHLECLHRYHCAVMSSPHYGSQASGESGERAADIADTIRGLLEPWYDSERVKAESVNAMAERYKERYGDPEDPGFKAILRKQLEDLRARQHDREVNGVPLTDDERVEARIRKAALGR